VSFSGGSWVPVYHNVACAETYIRTKWHVDLSSRLATIDIGRKWGLLCPFRGGGAVGSPSDKCGLGRGLPPCQVASSSILPFRHNRHGPKMGRCCSAPLLGELGPAFNRMWPRPRPTSVPSGILIHPAVWPHYPAPASQKGGRAPSPIFGPSPLWPNGWMDQDGT